MTDEEENEKTEMKDCDFCHMNYTQGFGISGYCSEECYHADQLEMSQDEVNDLVEGTGQEWSDRMY